MSGKTGGCHRAVGEASRLTQAGGVKRSPSAGKALGKARRLAYAGSKAGRLTYPPTIKRTISSELVSAVRTSPTFEPLRRTMMRSLT
jgi:hypothetical protein